MIYLYLFGTCFHFIYVFMIIGKKYGYKRDWKAAQRYGIERVFFFLLKIVICLFIKWS